MAAILKSPFGISALHPLHLDRPDLAYCKKKVENWKVLDFIK